jgi:hypothetical protein
MSDENGRRLQRVGVLWSPRPGAKSLGSGSVTINGLRQRFVIFKNDRKKPGSKDPDYTLMSSEEPEVDEYATKRQPTTLAAPPPSGPQTREEGWVPTDEDVPF